MQMTSSIKIIVFATAVVLVGSVALSSRSDAAPSIHRSNSGNVSPRVSASPMVWLQGDELTASDGAGGDNFGMSEAATDSVLVIGAPDKSVNNNFWQGAVYVFVKSNGSWQEVQKLTASNGAAFDNFGQAVAITGNSIFVTATGATVSGNTQQGAVYVFTKSNGTWTQAQELTASDGTAGEELGWSISISGTTAVVGATGATVNNNPYQGAAYVFTESNGTWSQAQKLTASDGGAANFFGRSVATNGGTILVGSVRARANGNNGEGAVYVYNDVNGSWSQTQKLTANDGTPNSNFGVSVDLYGTEAIVGAPNAMSGGVNGIGAAYVFNQYGTNWYQTQKLEVSDGAPGNQFGWSAGFRDANTVLVSMPYATVNGQFDQGATYVFSDSSGTWQQTHKLVTSDGASLDEFGYAITRSGPSMIVSAYNAAVNGPSGQGKVYVYGNAALSLALNAPGHVNPGREYTSQTVATNDSTSVSPAVTAIITVPAAASLVSASASQGSCNNEVGAVACNFGPIAGNAGSATANVVLRAANNPGGTVYNTASLARATPSLSTSAPSAINQLPVADDGTLTTPVDTAANGVLKASDLDNDSLTFSIVSQPGHGKVTINDASKGVYTYTPAANYSGADSFTFKVNDGYADSNTATVIINVTNLAPVAKNSNLTTNEDKSVDGALQASDPDGDGVSYSIVAPPGYGSVNLDPATGKFTYTPQSGFAGIDSFSFNVSDGQNQSNTAKVTINVQGSSAPPPANSGSSGGGAFNWPELLVLLILGIASFWGGRSKAFASKRGYKFKEVEMGRKCVVIGGLMALLVCMAIAPEMANAKSATAETPAGAKAKTGYQAGLTMPLPNSKVRSNYVALKSQTSLSVLAGATKVGPHAADSSINLTFSLKLRNLAQLGRLLKNVQNPKSPVYHQYLTPAEFTQKYGPTQAQVDDVVRYLHRAGIHVNSVSRNRLLIHTNATTATYEGDLGIGINDYQLNGRSFFSTSDNPKLPKEIAGVVQGVIGLNNAVQMHPMSYTTPLRLSHRAGAAVAASPALSAPPPATAYFNPFQIATAYDWPSIDNSNNGAGVTVAIVTAESSGLASNPSPSDFWSAYGLPNHTVNVIPVDGDNGSTQGMIETLLDMEYDGAMAPGVTQDVYVGANAKLSTFTDLYNKFVDDDEAQVMTTSWGSPEIGWDTSTDEAIFMQGAAEGISMFAAAGDHGSSDGTNQANMADYPAVSAYVTAANGTDLSVSDISGDYGSESAWSDTGGAISQVIQQPSWQTGPGVPNTGYRMNSDMAMNAGSLHPYLLYVAGMGWLGVYGTSAVAPQFAALFAIGVSQQPNHASLGQSNELIYDDVNAGNEASDFRDVTTGSNGAYAAGVGWDHPTGWGSPKATSLLSHIGVQGPSGTLQGTVTDSNGNPVAGARISATPGIHQAVTDNNGNYSLPLETGSYTVTAQSFGYSNGQASVSITQNNTTTQDFTLTEAAKAKISGKVSDNSGHGYGLYAQVVVTTSGFGQVAQVWTNPTTGAYSVTLPEGYAYKMSVIPAFDGYQLGSKSLTLQGGTTQNFPLDITSTCSAPGYSFVKGFSQDFNGNSFPPSGWSVKNGISNSTVSWATAADWQVGNWTGGTGETADAGAQVAWAHPPGPYDTSLVTPPIPVTSLPADPVLRYKTNFQHTSYDSEALDLDISTDGGSSWTTISHWASASDSCGGDASLPGCDVRVNLGPYMPGSGSVVLRWHYYDPAAFAHDMYAQVDDVAIGECEPQAGGLVFGQVTDGNTGKGIDWATVSDDQGDKVDTWTNASDPNFPVGGYLFFVPAGQRTLTASDHRYSNASAQLSLANNEVKTQNFVLNAGQLAVNPGQYTLNVMVNDQKSVPFAITNSGTAGAHFSMVSVDAPPPSTAQGHGAPLQKIKGRFSPLSVLSGPVASDMSRQVATANQAPWKGIAAYPTPVYDNGVARDPTTGLVYSVDGVDGQSNFLSNIYAFNPSTDSWNAVTSNLIAREAPQVAVIGGKLYVTGGWDSQGKPVADLGIYDPATDSWSTGAAIPTPYAGAARAVVNGKLYVVGGCSQSVCGNTATQVYDPKTNKWSEAAAYPHPVAWEACGGIGGKLYCAGGLSGGTAYNDGYVYDPSTNKWSSIPNMPADLWASGYTGADGELLVSGGVANNTLTNEGYAYDPASNSWNRLPNSNSSVYRGGSACGFYEIGGVGAGGVATDGEQLPGYDQCGTPVALSWLTPSPASGTVAPGNTVKGQLIVDGTGQKELTTSTGYIRVEGNTPYSDQYVPVSVTWDPQPVDLVLSGDVSAKSVQKGDDFAYTLTIQNQQLANHGPASQVTLTYQLPSGVTYEASSGGGSCTESSGIVMCDLGTIALGSTETETLEVKGASAGNVVSTFQVNAREPQSGPGSDTVTLTNQVLGTADMALSAPSSDSMSKDGSGTLEFKVTDNGPDTSSDVKFVAKPAVGVNFLSATASQGNCSISSETLSCSIGQLAKGATATVEVDMEASSVGTGVINAQVSTASNDPDTGNNGTQTLMTVTAATSGSSGGGGSFGWLGIAVLLGLVLMLRFAEVRRSE